VDVARGELGVYLTSAAGTSLIASFAQPLWLYNDTASAVTLPAGAVRMEVTGRYQVSAQGAAQASAQLAINLASGTSDVSIFAQLLGRVSQSINFIAFAPASTHSSTNAAIAAPTVTVIAADRTSLRVDITTPQFTLPAGGVAQIWPSLNGASPSAGNTLDFLTVPARLCLTLPPGVRLLDNSVNPLNWSCP